MRGTVYPRTVRRYRNRSQLFDAALIEAYSPIQAAFPDELASIDIAVDTVPRMRLNPDVSHYSDEIAADGPVPLGRLIPAGIDQLGRPTRPRIVLFRMPIEQRCDDMKEKVELLHTVLTSLVAAYLNIEPTTINPNHPW